MLQHFSELIDKVKAMPRTVVCVANADSETVEAARMALDKGLADVILYGDEAVVRPLVEQAGIEGRAELRHAADPATALREAVRSVRGGESGVLMKGMLNSSDFLRGVLNKEEGLRTGRRLSHIAAVELPGYHKLIYSTDGGMNINPDLAAKKDILAGLVEAWERGEFPTQCIVEGPIAMDVALNRESALHKGIESRVSGDADIFLMPIMEVGNVAIKGLLHFLKGSQVAGLILGAAAPVVMTSRSEPPSAKLYATALGCLAARNA